MNAEITNIIDTFKGVTLLHAQVYRVERADLAMVQAGIVQMMAQSYLVGWFALLPSNAFGAIASRSLVYWLRDRRYIMNIIVVPVAGVLTVFPLIVAGVPVEIAALVPVPVMALFFGWLPLYLPEVRRAQRRLYLSLHRRRQRRP